jgi:hypothetical protein
MPSVDSFMCPKRQCVTAAPDDTLQSVVESFVHEHVGCVVVVDPEVGPAAAGGGHCSACLRAFSEKMGRGCPPQT